MWINHEYVINVKEAANFRELNFLRNKEQMRLRYLLKPSASVPGVAGNTQRPPIFGTGEQRGDRAKVPERRAGLSRKEQAMLAAWCAAPTSADL